MQTKWLSFLVLSLSLVLVVPRVEAKRKGPPVARTSGTVEVIATEGDVVAGRTLKTLTDSLILTDGGDVVYAAGFDTDGFGLFGSNPARFILGAGSEIAGHRVNGLGGPAISPSGTLVFFCLLEDVGQGLCTPTAPVVVAGQVVGGITVLAPMGGAITDTNTVAFVANYRDANGRGRRGVFTTEAGLIAASGSVIDGTPMAQPTGGIAINAAGVVAFAANVTNTPLTTGIFTQTQFLGGTGSVLGGQTVESVANPAINDAGEVVFFATLQPTGSGIWSSTRGWLVKTGDTLAGSPVTAVGDQPHITGSGEASYLACTASACIVATTTQGIVFTDHEQIAGKDVFTLNSPVLNEAGQVAFRFVYDDSTMTGGVARVTQKILRRPHRLVRITR